MAKRLDVFLWILSLQGAIHNHCHEPNQLVIPIGHRCEAEQQ